MGLGNRKGIGRSIQSHPPFMIRKNNSLFTRFFLVGCSLCSAAVTILAQGNLLQNGSFETGDFTGWQVQLQPGTGGDFFVTKNLNPPLRDNPAFATAGPSDGQFYAVNDSASGGAYTLIQPFNLSAGAHPRLTFDMFLNNWSGAYLPNDTTLSTLDGPNQHARVDILAGGASAFETGSGVAMHLLTGGEAHNEAQPYTHYSFDLDPLPAGAYQLRFAEIDTVQLFNMGIDNVSITAIPEPQLWTFASGVLALFFIVGKRKA
jgi:hypothetical protein